MATGSANPFYDPTWYDPAFGPQFNQTQAGRYYYDQNPQTAYTALTSPYAGGNDAFSQFVRSQWTPAYQGYQAQSAVNPDLHAYDYFARVLDPNALLAQFNALSPSARGEQWGRFAGPVRWISH